MLTVQGLEKQFNKAIERNGASFNIQGISYKGIIEPIKDTSSTDRFYLLVKVGSIVQGAIMTLNGSKYMVTTLNREQNGIYDRLTVESVFMNLNFIVDETLQSCQCMAITGGQSVDFNTSVNVVNGKIQFVVPLNEMTNKIKQNERFIKFNGAWKVIATTKEKEGLVYIFCEKDAVGAGDDLVNEIPLGLPVYTLAFYPPSYDLTMGSSQQITPVVTKNGQSISNGFKIAYSSSNVSVATVDSNGLVQSLGQGTATITGILNDGIKSATLAINVLNAQVVTVEITPKVVSLLQTAEQIYTVKKYINGIAQVDTFTTVPSVAPTANYTLTVIDGNTFKVKNLKYYSGGKLKVTCTTTDGLNSTFTEIQLKGSF